MLGESILMINPRGKRRRRGRGGRFVKRARSRRRAVARVSRRRRRRNPMGTFIANPRRRRRTVSHIVRRSRRRNPRFSLAGITRQLIPAAIGGAGALGLDMALAVVPVPAMLKSGPFAILTKAAGAIGLGYLTGMVFGRENGKLVAMGGLTVVAYQAIKGLAQQVAPTLPGLSDYEDFQGIGMGAYENRLGYVDPAPVLRGYEPPTSRDSTVMGGDFGDDSHGW